MTRTGPSPRQRLTVVGALAGLALVVVLVIALISYGDTPGSVSDPATKAPIPSASDEPLQKNELQQFIDTFGPFAAVVVDLDASAPDTSAPAILLFAEDGGTRASTEHKLPFDPSHWRQQEAFDGAASITMDHGYAVIKTMSRNTHVVQIGQAFAFEASPDRLYLIDKDRKVWSVRASIAAGLVQPL